MFIIVCDTYFHHSKKVHSLYNNKIFNIKVVFLHLAVMNQQYLDSSEKSQSYVLTIQINQLIIMNSP